MTRKLCFVYLKTNFYNDLPFIASTNWSAMFTQLGADAEYLTGIRNRTHLYTQWKDTSQPMETNAAIFFPPLHADQRGIYLRQ